MENENIRENENLNEEVTEDTAENAEVTEETVEETAEEVEEVQSEETEIAELAEPENVEDLIGNEWQQRADAGETGWICGTAESLNEEEQAAKRKKQNRIIAICAALAVVIAFAAYWVCRVEGIGTSTVVSVPMLEEEAGAVLKDNVRFENPMMAVVNTFTHKKNAIMTVDGVAVDRDVFEYATNSAIRNCVMSLMQTGMISDISEFDINAKAFDTDLTYLEYAKAMATETVIPVYGLIAVGEKNGITFDEEDEKEAADWIASLKEQYGAEFEEALRQSGYSGEEALLKIQKVQLHMDKVYADAQENLEKYVSTESLAKLQTEEKVTVKHILIAFDEEGTGDVTDEKKVAALAEAEEVLKKLQAGGDFDKLMEEHNDDPGATTKGYTFADDGTMVQQFTDASFALQVGETSGLVETTYGYHIIQRMELRYTIDDYVNYLCKNSDVRIRKGNFADSGVTIDLQALYGGAE